MAALTALKSKKMDTSVNHQDKLEWSNRQLVLTLRGNRPEDKRLDNQSYSSEVMKGSDLNIPLKVKIIKPIPGSTSEIFSDPRYRNPPWHQNW